MKTGALVPEIRRRTARRFEPRLRFRDALAACAHVLPRLPALRPDTPLRALSLIALCALARSRGIRVTPSQHKAVVATMELGALLNDRFDGDPYDPRELRRQAAWFAAHPHRELIRGYVKRLRPLERRRPARGADADLVRIYREQVNHLSLATLWALAAGTNLAAAESLITGNPDMNQLFRIVMLTQVMDDVLDRREDTRRNLPSFATAAGSDKAFLRTIISSYTNGASRDAVCGSLRLAARITGACALACVALMPTARPPRGS